ncbi:hypothetical protein DU490_10830 [Halomonas sp. DQ26W]|nr:hypothetical protein DU490_10830 [Halomonas sp. DQ26W]
MRHRLSQLVGDDGLGSMPQWLNILGPLMIVAVLGRPGWPPMGRRRLAVGGHARRGKLWGLLACHGLKPMPLKADLRDALCALTQVAMLRQPRGFICFIVGWYALD